MAINKNVPTRFGRQQSGREALVDVDIAEGDPDLPAVTSAEAIGIYLLGTAIALAGDRDTDGNPVPTWKGHAYTYNASGNLETDTVTDGENTWVRTYMWQAGAQTADTGWVKQNG